jgi:hypothetical protein
MQTSWAAPKARHWMAMGWLFVSTVGCTTEHWVETEILPKGEVVRSIFQPFDGSPSIARDPRKWSRVGRARSSIVIDQLGSISDIKIQGPPKSGDHFVAQGRFRSVEEIPEHFVMKPFQGAPLPDGRLVRAYTRNDLGFVIEHSWTETLTDSVSFDDMKSARTELFDLALGVLNDEFDSLFGKRYDTSKLVDWLKTEGRDWFAEATDTIFVEVAANGFFHTSDRIDDRLAVICARHGLVLRKDGRRLNSAAIDKAILAFGIGVAQKLLRTRDGKPLTREEILALYEKARSEAPKLDEEDQNRARMKKFDAFTFADFWICPPQPSRLQVAAQNVIEGEKYGGREAFQKKFNSLANRVFGLYMVHTVDHPDFRFDLRLPGEIVESNGSIIARDRTRWRFLSVEAYPFGYSMKCRSLELDAKMMKLIKEQPLPDRDVMIRYVRLVQGEDSLIKVLRDCRDRESLDPLKTYRLSLGFLANITRSTAVHRMHELLKIPLR